MMVQTLIPCSPAASKTEEILSRYRPIAPKPELPASSSTDGGVEDATPHKIRHSPYLRNIWAHLQARPTRTRKRGRNSITPAAAPTLKRPQKIAQTPFLGLCCPSPLSSPSKCLSFQGFISPNLNGLEEKPVTLPLLSSSSASTVEASFNKACQVGGITAIDLNCAGEVLEETDLILQLKSPTTVTNPWTAAAAPHVIVAPKPIKPIGSIIWVGPISLTQRAEAEPKMLDEVEEEVEAQELPAVISDSNNKVRMVNSAYKELVGQPECPWLDSLTASVTGRRISGEVMLQMPAGSELPVSSNGFSCWARIEWASSSAEGNKKMKESVDAFCDVVKLHCDSKNYLFSWRFHTNQATP